MRRFTILFAIVALAAAPAYAKKPASKSGKDSKAATPRVLIFDPGDPKVRPTFYYEIDTPERVSAAPIMFSANLTTEPEKEITGIGSGSDSGSDVPPVVSEKSMMLDQTKTANPLDATESKKLKGSKPKAEKKTDK